MATIYDVAKAAGVSIATVSKVVNQTGRISDKTRRHVLQLMKELDYEPSVVAAAMTKKRTNTIGLLLPDLANPFFAEIARSVEDHAQTKGFSVIMCSTDNKPAKEASYISLLKQKRVDGILLATGVKNDENLLSLLERKLPVALIAREAPRISVDSVLVDDFLGGHMAASYLIELGHRTIAVIAEELDVTSSRERIRGYRQALEDAAIEYDEQLVLAGSFDAAGGRRAAAALLALEQPPTAIFACNDILAVGAVQAARESGIAVPGQLSVVGFDNTIIASITEPPLTTIAQPIAELGKHAVELIASAIGVSEQPRRRIVLQPELVVRGSAARVSLVSPHKS